MLATYHCRHRLMLATLLSSLTPKDFIGTHWEQQHLLQELNKHYRRFYRNRPKVQIISNFNMQFSFPLNLQSKEVSNLCQNICREDLKIAMGQRKKLPQSQNDQFNIHNRNCKDLLNFSEEFCLNNHSGTYQDPLALSLVLSPQQRDLSGGGLRTSVKWEYNIFF